MKTAAQQQTHMEVKSIPIDKIILTENTRKKIVKDDDYEGFKQSIAANGLLQPIGVVEKDGQYELTWGFRRLEVHKDLGWPEISAVICTGVNAQGLKIIENMQRQDITPLELAAAIKSYQEDSGLTFSEIAGILGKSLTDISKINRLNDLILSLRNKLEKNEIELDAALYIARYPIPEQTDFSKDYSFRNVDIISLKHVKSFFNKRNIKLSSFPWPKDKEFKKLPKCTDCNDRSSCQSVLFPEIAGQDDTCLNKKCMENKISIYVNEKFLGAKKEGNVILIRTSYYPDFRFPPVTSTVFDKEDFRLAKKDDKEKDIITGIIIASDNVSDLGQVQKYVKKKDGSGDRQSSQKIKDNLTPAQEQQKRLQNYKRKKELILFPMALEIGKQLTSEIKKLDFKKHKQIPVEALNVIGDYVLQHANWSYANRLRGLWDPQKNKNDVGKIYSMLVEAATHYDGLDNLGNAEFYSTHSREYKRLREIAPILGIDLQKIESTIKPKYDEKVNTLKERFILRNKIDPEKPAEKKKKPGTKKAAGKKGASK
jgi:ParB/RepB/Spo0J family partition protein